MQARYFRNLFENARDGLVYTGYVWDNIRKKEFLYIYFSGELSQEVDAKRQQEIVEKIRNFGDTKIDMLVVGEITPTYIKIILELVKKCGADMVVMPYIAPIKRYSLLHYMNREDEDYDEIKSFLEAPYKYFVEHKVQEIFFLYQNGNQFIEEDFQKEEGSYFQKVGDDQRAIIDKMEGIHIPVYQAGFVIQNDWLFVFGNFCESHRAMLERISNTKDGSHMVFLNFQMETTVTMFAGPLGCGKNEVNSMFTQRPYKNGAKCNFLRGKDFDTCLLKCMYHNDYDEIHHHNRTDATTGKYGVLLLGNLNLNTYLGELQMYYEHLIEQVRVVSIPNCGNRQQWNGALLDLFQNQDYQYFALHINERTSGDMMKEVLSRSGHYKIATIGSEIGSCFAGYLVPHDEF